MVERYSNRPGAIKRPLGEPTVYLATYRSTITFTRGGVALRNSSERELAKFEA